MKARAKKSLGQNFLIDKNIINKIVYLGDISEKDNILEIGPGTGNLTKEIIKKKPKKIFLIEKDTMLSNRLLEMFKNKVKIYNSDILKFDESKISNNKLIIFGNLPYNISTQILVKLIINDKLFFNIKKFIFMFQKDVAERIIANSNEKQFGRLSIISNWRFKIKKEFDVSNNCFYPKPKVESSILTFEPKKFFVKFNNSKNLEYITKIFFSERRKMIKKPLKKIFFDYKKIATLLNLNLNLRPQNLTCDNFFSITKKYEELIN